MGLPVGRILFSFSLSIVALSTYSYILWREMVPGTIGEILTPVLAIYLGIMLMSLVIPVRPNKNEQKGIMVAGFVRFIASLTAGVFLTSFYIFLVWLPNGIPQDYPEIVVVITAIKLLSEFVGIVAYFLVRGSRQQ